MAEANIDSAQKYSTDCKICQKDFNYTRANLKFDGIVRKTGDGGKRDYIVRCTYCGEANKVKHD